MNKTDWIVLILAVMCIIALAVSYFVVFPDVI